MTTENSLQTLPLKDKIAWAGYTAVTIATLGALKMIGADHLVADLGKSGIDGMRRVIEHGLDIETMKVGAMAVGFALGVGTDIFMMDKTKRNLAGHAELVGTGEVTVNENGVEQVHETCGDKRIPRWLQQVVELGAGYNQGPLLRNVVVSALIANSTENTGVNGVGVDLLTGFLMGRRFTAGAISTVTHLKSSIEGRAIDKKPRQSFEHPHREGCGMTAADHALNYYNKFIGKNPALVDLNNAITSIFNFPMTAMEQTIGVPLSKWKRIRYPAGFAPINK